MRQFIQDYKKTLKPIETEEVVDLIFFRPIAFLLVQLVRKINFSPNYYTSISLIFGLLSGYCFGRGWLELAALCVFLMEAFDCADGQLARLKSLSSRYGKIFDVIADVISYIAMLTGIAVYQYAVTHDPYPFLGAALAFSALSLNVFFFDQFKNQYITYVYSDYHDRLESLANLYNSYLASKGSKRFCNHVYYKIYRFETKVTRLGSLTDRTRYSAINESNSHSSPAERELYKKVFALPVRLWTFIGTSTHLVIMIILALLHKVELVISVFIYYSLIACLILIAYQNIACAIYERERQNAKSGKRGRIKKGLNGEA